MIFVLGCVLEKSEPVLFTRVPVLIAQKPHHCFSQIRTVGAFRANTPVIPVRLLM
jgi:hypothetical protein